MKLFLSKIVARILWSVFIDVVVLHVFGMITTLFLIANLSNFYDANKCKNSLNVKLQTYYNTFVHNPLLLRMQRHRKQFGKYIGHLKMYIYNGIGRYLYGAFQYQIYFGSLILL